MPRSFCGQFRLFPKWQPAPCAIRQCEYPRCRHSLFCILIAHNNAVMDTVAVVIGLGVSHWAFVGIPFACSLSV